MACATLFAGQTPPYVIVARVRRRGDRPPSLNVCGCILKIW